MALRYAVIVLAVGIGAPLIGCSSVTRPDRDIGEGPATLIFDNDGAETIEVRVVWTDEEGERQRREFNVHGSQIVTLRLEDRAEYRIVMDAECSDGDCEAESSPDHPPS